MLWMLVTIHRAEMMQQIMCMRSPSSEFVCRKTAGPGVAKLSAYAGTNRHARAQNAAIGHFLMFESYDNHKIKPLWVARVVANTAPGWKG